MFWHDIAEMNEKLDRLSHKVIHLESTLFTLKNTIFSSNWDNKTELKLIFDKLDALEEDFKRLVNTKKD